MIFGLVALLPAASVVAEGGKIEKYNDVRVKHAALIDTAKAEVKTLQDRDVKDFDESIEEVKAEAAVYTVVGKDGKKVDDIVLQDGKYYDGEDEAEDKDVDADWKQGEVQTVAIEAHPEIKGREKVKAFTITEAEKAVKAAKAAEKAELKALGLSTRLLGGSAFYAKKSKDACWNNKKISIPATLMVGIAGHLAYRNLISEDLTMDELLRVTKACFFILGKEESIKVLKENKVLAGEIYAFLGSAAAVGTFGTLKALNK